jgi:3-oxoacyl-[acyl-carrier protein] reductase
VSAQWALVTGASRGIGQATAVRLARAGVNVVVHYGSDQAGAEKTAAACGEAGVDAVVVRADLQVGVDPLVEAMDSVGGVGILVNNAGVTADGFLMMMDRAKWDRVLRVNLDGAYFCIRATVRAMLMRGWGRIINITSPSATSGLPGQANYAASKAGLIGFSKALAREVASRNITVNVVTPGLVETDMTKALTDKAQADWASAIPLGRLGTLNEVAAAVCFLASDEAAYITGHVLAVNGGMYM